MAIEILHNAFLVHDDIEDASDERRGAPHTARPAWGPVAVNVGDALSVLGLRPLLENRRILGVRVSMRILEEVERMVRETIEGQAIELGWRRANTTESRPRRLLANGPQKDLLVTTIFPNRVGALIATKDGIDLESFLPFGFFLGSAFQIQDDVLNIVGDKRQYGKELKGDLWEGKRTFMIIHLLEQASSKRENRTCAGICERVAKINAPPMSAGCAA